MTEKNGKVGCFLCKSAYKLNLLTLAYSQLIYEGCVSGN